MIYIGIDETTIKKDGEFEIYISPDGRIFKEIKQWSDKDGYRYVTVSHRNLPVHRLVAKKYVPGRTLEKDVVCHKDDNPENNQTENLEWGTYSKNNYDVYKRFLKSKNICIRCIETVEIFHSAREAARSMFGKPKRGDHILQVIREERGKAYGYHREVVCR